MLNKTKCKSKTYRGLVHKRNIIYRIEGITHHYDIYEFCYLFSQLLIAGFQAADPSRGGSNSITLRNLSISIPMFKIREIELKNTQNFFVNEDSTITCDENDIKVNLSFGMSVTTISGLITF